MARLGIRTAAPALAVALAGACGSEHGDDGSNPDGIHPSCDPPPEIVGQSPMAELLSVAERAEMPGISEQTTARGQAIATLYGFGARLFIGYGDWADNTGPIAVLSYDPVDGSFEASETLATEEITGFFADDESLFVPDIDPVGHQATGSVFRLDPGNGWRPMTPIDGAVHSFALVSHGGRLLLATGSLADEPAFVMSTDDGGETWIEEQSRSVAGGYTRIRHMAATADMVVATGHSTGPSGAHFAHVLRAEGWTELDGVPQDDGPLLPIAAGEHAMLVKMDGEPGRGGRHEQTLVVADAEAVPACLLPDGHAIVAWQDTGSELTAITSDGAGISWLMTTANGAQWHAQQLPPLVDDEYTSVGALDTTYLGTQRGDLYRVAAR